MDHPKTPGRGWCHLFQTGLTPVDSSRKRERVSCDVHNCFVGETCPSVKNLVFSVVPSIKYSILSVVKSDAESFQNEKTPFHAISFYTSHFYCAFLFQEHARGCKLRAKNVMGGRNLERRSPKERHGESSYNRRVVTCENGHHPREDPCHPHPRVTQGTRRCCPTSIKAAPSPTARQEAPAGSLRGLAST